MTVRVTMLLRSALAGLAFTALVGGLLIGSFLSARSASRGNLAATAPGPTMPPSAQVPTVSISPDATGAIKPTTPITVTASGGTLTSVTAISADGVPVRGRLTDDERTWRSSAALEYRQTYHVLASATAPSGRETQEQRTIHTLTPLRVAYPNMVPAPDSVDSVGVGQPIVFQFSQPVANRSEVEKHLHVTSLPPQPGAWRWIDERNAHFRPKDFWKPGTVISVAADVYGVDFGGGVYGAKDRQASYQVHDSWIARADGSTQEMTIFRNGAALKTMPISMGKRRTPTHRGIHIVSEKAPDYIMNSCTYGVCKRDPGYYRSHERWSVRISNDGEFVHENPNSISAQGNRNISHGCINLNAEDGKWFYQHFGAGDVVDVTHSNGPQLPVWDLYGDWSLSWRQWKDGDSSP